MSAMRSQQQDQLLDEEYDGIREYDNPMPKWWLWIFLATILYSLLYWLNVPGIGIGKGRMAAYEKEVAAAEAKRAVAARTAGPVTPEALLALTTDPERLAQGKQTFVTTCAPCHREDGGGNIGPNLTDDYWIHGGKPLDILKTVTDGVPDKGMPTWTQVLGPDQIKDVVAYVITLHGTHPPHPKEPQGVREESGPSGRP